VAIHVQSRQIDRVADWLISIASARARAHRAAVAQIDDADYAHGRTLILIVLCSVTASM
jgi:hypothetical protein